MKYTFVNKSGNQQTVNIDDEWIRKQCSLLHISKREAIDMWLSDEGYIENEVVAALTEQAKKNGVKTGAAAGKPRKKPVRKPDYAKSALINYVRDMIAKASFDTLETEDGETLTPHNIEITNIERVISFAIGEDKYELTLSKKRKPKT